MSTDEAPALPDERLGLALGRAWHALEDQRDRLADFRGRAVALLGTASVSVGVAVGVGGKESLPLRGVLAWTTAALFVAMTVLAGFILLPRKWVFSSDPANLEWLLDHAFPDPMRRQLFDDAAVGYKANEDQLAVLGKALFAQTVVLGLTTLGLLSSLWGR